MNSALKDRLAALHEKPQALPNPVLELSPLPAGWQVIRQTGDGFIALHGARQLQVACSDAWRDGRRWRHVCVSGPKRAPRDDDVRYVRNIFIGEEREAYEIHAPKSRHVGVNPNARNLWCPLDGPALPDFTAST